MASQFGNWQIDRALQEGGQSHTFLVRETVADSKSARVAVLKRLKNPKRLDRFRRELEAYQSLSHANIVKVLDSNLETKDSYIVTEYCSGGSLKDAKLKIAALPLLDKLHLFGLICKALACAHANDPVIVHRDIKPDNIFLRESLLEPVVGDFGLCFLDEDEDAERFTATEEGVGPRFYMAPELADGRSDTVKPSADVYSLGKLLYWLVSGGRIFDREKHRAPKFDLTAGKVDPEFFHIYDVLDKTIALDPRDRFPDASTLSKALEDLIRVISLSGRYIDIDIPQRCIFCKVGLYEKKADSQNVPSGRLDGNSWRVNAESQVKEIGFDATYDTRWIIMVCNRCANLQIFRPDLANKKDLWKSKQGL